MTITLTNRKTARAQLKTVLETGVETLLSIADLAAYASEPKDFGGRSPVLTVHGDGTRTEFGSPNIEYHKTWVTMYWKRDAPATTEDKIDDMHHAVRQTLINNAELAGYWNDLLFDEDFSEMAYVLIENVQYRTERLPVTIVVYCA